MKSTHQSKTNSQTDVTAYQFSHEGLIPVWVVRKFHRVGGHGWSGFDKKGQIVQAKVGDWAVLVENTIILLTDKEFNENFRKI